MDGIERNSHQAEERGCSKHREAYRTTHARFECIGRHQHAGSFAAVVLRGRYVEAGDTGRHRLSAGDVIVHHAWEAHLDRFEEAGAEVLVLPLEGIWSGAPVGQTDDPDELAKVAERDVVLAARLLKTRMVPHRFEAEDWPDNLALDLLRDPGLELANWARDAGIHPGSIGRGFAQQFGVSAASFRTTARAHRAIQAIMASREDLVDVAASAGFSDQSHMTRIVVRITGHTPADLRGATRRSTSYEAQLHRPAKAKSA